MGNTLKQLDYSATNEVTGFLRLARYIDSRLPQTNPTVTMDYLTLSTNAQNPIPSSYNFHAGFFDREGQSDNKYFLMANLITTESRWVSLTVTDNGSDFINTRFRNIESEYNFDITFTNQTAQTFNFPAGEGYLFQVAPVVKYGGKLVYNETVLGGTTLTDDMTIESGATLTVNGIYNAKANITVKTGGKIVAGTNGKIVFDVGKKIIIQGSAEIRGTSSFNKLTLQYSGPDNGIVVKPGSSLILDYCNITGPYQGILTETGSQSYLYISNSTISAAYSGISLVAGTQDESFQTPPTPTIINCSITAGISGISVSNYGSVLIKANTITNSGISILNVSAAYIQNNNISLGSNSNQSGIFMNNSGGYIRSNTVKNRVNGILLANSSPDIGGNLLENNYKHGLYIGSGSFPNLVGLVQTNPPTYYPLAGYNTIRNNGNDTRSGGENDGSEIYFSYSDAHLGTLTNPGCNQISDDRTATP